MEREEGWEGDRDEVGEGLRIIMFEEGQWEGEGEEEGGELRSYPKQF